MRIEVTPTIDDLVEFVVYQSSSGPAKRDWRRYVMTTVVMTLLVMASFGVAIVWHGGLAELARQMPTGELVFYTALGLAMWGCVLWQVLGGTPPVIRWVMRRRIRRHPEAFWMNLVRRTITIEERGLVIIGDGFLHRSPWKHVTDVVRDGRRIYVLFISNHVEIIPEDAFGSREEFEDFIEAVREYRVESTQDEPAAIVDEPKEGVTYSPNSDDLAALRDYFWKRYPLRQRGYRIAAACLAIASAVAFPWLVWQLTSHDRFVDLSVAVAVGILVMAMLMLFSTIPLVGRRLTTRRRHCRKQFARHPKRFRFFQMPTRVSLETEGMWVFVDGREEFTAWWRIPMVLIDKRTESCFLCLLYSVRRLEAIIVPRRAFESDKAFTAWGEEAERLWGGKVS